MDFKMWGISLIILYTLLLDKGAYLAIS